MEGKRYTLQPNMFKIKRYQKTVHGNGYFDDVMITSSFSPPVVDVIPSVIEPSFGIGRILYTILEHSFGVREGDEQRVWLALPASVAPVSCSVLPLSSNDQFTPFIQSIGWSGHRLYT